MAHLKGLFIIALSNFVFPALFSIAQLIVTFRDPDFLVGAYIFMVNIYVSIIGVVFATVWAGTTRWIRDQRGVPISFDTRRGVGTSSIGEWQVAEPQLSSSQLGPASGIGAGFDRASPVKDIPLQTV